jgi:arylsulfatase A-like enzyme
MPEAQGSSPVRTTLSDWLFLALGAALLAGYGEVAVLAWQRYVGGEFTHRGPDFAWVTPVAYVLLFLVPGIVIAIGAVVWPRLITFRRGAFLLALAVSGCWVLLLGYQRLHIAALGLLAIGAAAQFSAIMENRARSTVDVARRGAMALGGLTIALAILLPAGRALRERRAIAGLPPAPTDAPNVLLLILDTVRASSLSLYGFPLPTTPQLERWAQRGVVFERALSTAPWTLPSHASLFTGLPPNQLQADWSTPLEREPETVAGRLLRRGWATLGVVANQIYAGSEHGLARGFIRYEDFPVSPGLIARAAFPVRRLLDSYRPREIVGNDELVGRRTAAEINRSFLAWSRRLPDGRPFFAFLNYFDAHDPYLPQAQDLAALGSQQDSANRLSPLRRFSISERREGMTADDIRIERERYEAAIRGLDREIGVLLDSLQQRGVLERTVVVVTSDHGEEFGEHGAFYHGHTLNAQALHVPLMIMYPPSVPAGRRVSDVVSLVDVAATISSLAAPSTSPMPGRSLVRHWDGSAPGDEPAFSAVSQGIRLPEWYPAATGNLWSVVSGPHHFIMRSDGRQELYDWLSDPDESRNLLGQDGVSPVTATLRDHLDQFRNAARR